MAKWRQLSRGCLKVYWRIHRGERKAEAETLPKYRVKRYVGCGVWQSGSFPARFRSGPVCGHSFIPPTRGVSHLHRFTAASRARSNILATPGPKGKAVYKVAGLDS